MALFTGRGDDGTTKTFGCDQRRSKNSEVAEALGTLDELNSFLGFVKLEPAEIHNDMVGKKSLSEIIGEVQQNLFTIQAELAGSDKRIAFEKVQEIENIVNLAEDEMPPITTFFVSGGSRLATLFDYSRTIARRAERRVVASHEIGDPKMSAESLAYLNRLSSLLYALARLSNYRAGVEEEKPQYK